MPIQMIKLEGETRLAALVARAYRIRGRDADAQRQRAEAALLRANPQLADLTALPRGTAIVVPADIGLEPGKDLESFGAIGKGLIDELGRSLDLLGKDLVAGAGREAQEAQQTTSIVKSRAFTTALGQPPRAVTDTVAAAAANAKDQAARAQKLAADLDKALAQARKDLKALEGRLA
jgi:hypothetical protein